MPDSMEEERGLMQILIEDGHDEPIQEDLNLIGDVEDLVERHNITSIALMKRAVESILIRRALDMSETKRSATDLLEIGRTTLRVKMGEYGIS